MIDLHSFHARICTTAGGFLVQNHRALLVKHKKLGIWLAPGGHVEAGELFHQAAEREVFEETGIRVRAISPTPGLDSERSQYLPNPISINLHWISRENYEARLSSKEPTQPHQTALWPMGCEQHINYLYLVESQGSVVAKHDPNESDGIDWFGASDIDSLATTPDIKREIQLILKLTSTM